MADTFRKTVGEIIILEEDFTADIGTATVSSGTAHIFDENWNDVSSTLLLTTTATVQDSTKLLYELLAAGRVGHYYTIVLKAILSDGQTIERTAAVVHIVPKQLAG